MGSLFPAILLLFVQVANSLNAEHIVPGASSSHLSRELAAHASIPSLDAVISAATASEIAILVVLLNELLIEQAESIATPEPKFVQPLTKTSAPPAVVAVDRARLHGFGRCLQVRAGPVNA
ncbi:MAG: hypothetical protein ACK4P3_09100 [Fimbriimonadaceae bacterium]